MATGAQGGDLQRQLLQAPWGPCVGARARAYLQWWARSGLMLQHLGHLYTTCPGFSCKLSMNSLVAFPLGTAPCRRRTGVRVGLRLHRF